MTGDLLRTSKDSGQQLGVCWCYLQQPSPALPHRGITWFAFITLKVLPERINRNLESCESFVAVVALIIAA